MRELDAKFTRSEIFFTAWRSCETSYQMKKKMKPIHGSPSSVSDEATRPKRNYAGVSVPENLPDKFFDPTTGELDLRRVTGREAYQFFQMQGIRLPIIPNFGPPRKGG